MSGASGLRWQPGKRHGSCGSGIVVGTLLANALGVMKFEAYCSKISRDMAHVQI